MHKNTHLGNIPLMAANWRTRLEDLLEAKKASLGGRLPLKPLSIEMGLSETGLRDLRQRTRDPGVETLQKVANFFGVSLLWLVKGDEADKVRINIVGEVIAGTDSWTAFDDYLQGGGEEDFSLGAVEPIGLRVRGRSMMPVYRDGDVLIAGRKSFKEELKNLIDRDCIVRTSDEESYVKMLRPGPSKGVFNLRSYNAAFAEIEGASIEWAAPVIWVKRA